MTEMITERVRCKHCRGTGKCRHECCGLKRQGSSFLSKGPCTKCDGTGYRLIERPDTRPPEREEKVGVVHGAASLLLLILLLCVSCSSSSTEYRDVPEGSIVIPAPPAWEDLQDDG